MPLEAPVALEDEGPDSLLHAAEVRDGAFCVEGLEPGRYQVQIEVRGIPCWATTCAAGAAPLAIDLSAGHPLEGRVETADGRPVPSAWVTGEAGGIRITCRADAEGAFVLRGLPSSELRVEAAGDLDGVELRSAVLRAPAEGPLRILLSPTPR